MLRLARNGFLERIGGGALSSVRQMATAKGAFVYVGCYTQKLFHVDGKGTGVAAFQLTDAEKGTLSYIDTFDAGENPSYLIANKKGTRMYAVNEMHDSESSITALSIDRDTGALTKLATQSCVGLAGCFLELDPSEQFVIAANYLSGTLGVLPVDEEGGVGPMLHYEQHPATPLGPNAERQADGPHAHAIVFPPGQERENENANEHYLAFATDLGLDSIIQYEFNAVTGLLTAVGNIPATVAGAGPRHMAWSPDAAHAYVANELAATVTAYDWKQESRELTPIHDVSTLPDDWKRGAGWLSAGGPDPENGVSHCAHVEVTPDGTKVLVSNRGHNSIATFARNSVTGKLTLLGHTASGGEIPRHFAITKDGSLVIAANQDTGNLVSMRFNTDDDGGETGVLERTGAVVDSPTAVSVLIVN